MVTMTAASHKSGKRKGDARGDDDDDDNSSGGDDDDG